MKLHFEEWGDRAPGIPQVILFHGMGGTGKLWRPLASSIESRCRVIAPDQRGHGKSVNPELINYHPLEFAGDVLETLDGGHNGPARDALRTSVLVGHSMGVRTAAALGSLRPEWFRAIVLIDLGLLGLTEGAFDWANELAQFIEKIPKKYESRDVARKELLALAPDPSLAQYILAVAKKESGGDGVFFPFDQKALIKTIRSAQAMQPDEIVRWLNSWLKFSTPHSPLQPRKLIFLRGQNSAVWTREAYLNDQKPFMGNPYVEFQEWEGAGHGLPFEKRSKLAELILTFFP